MIILFLNLAITWFMVGLIWIIQIVHYPLFSAVGTEEFKTFHLTHKILISPLAGSLMVFELVTSLILLLQTPKGVPIWAVIVLIILLSIIWGSTFFLQVPYHEKLELGFDNEIHNLLLDTNWIRTICWSLRGFLLLLVLDFYLKNNG